MDYTDVQTLIVDNIALFGVAVVSILSSLVLLMVGLLVFRWGWRQVRVTTEDTRPQYMKNYDNVNLDAVSDVIQKRYY